MVEVFQILRLADDFERELTPDDEPYYEPFRYVDFEVDPHSKYRIPELIVEEEKSTSPPIYRLNEEEFKRSARLIYIIWFETEIKINHYTENAINYMNSAGVPSPLIIRFKELVTNINATIYNLKQLPHWKTEDLLHSNFWQLQSKSEILHNEISNLSEYINMLSDIYSLFEFHLEEFHSKKESNTSEYRLYSMSARSVDRIRGLLEAAHKATLDSMRHKQMDGGEWKFEPS